MMTDSLPPQSFDAPAQRLRRVGLDVLSDTEVLALALGASRSGETELNLARSLLATHAGLRGVMRAGLGTLAREIGERRAARLVSAMELARRAMATPLVRSAPYRSSRDVVRAYGPRMLDATEERVLAVVLDAKQRPVAERELARGTSSTCALGVREVFALIVREGGTGLLLVHNHPSGDPTPSEADVNFTRDAIAASVLLDLLLVDHVIVARDGSFSFLDSGLLQTLRDKKESQS